MNALPTLSVRDPVIPGVDGPAGGGPGRTADGAPLIVILDDRGTNRNIFARLAASVEPGIAVRAFAAPDEALAWLDANTPDLVITDYKMPGMDGAEFTEAFRAMPACADVPVVVITVYEDRSFRLRALEAGATDFLQSPVDHHEFLTRARNLLKLRRQQQLIKSRAFLLEHELLVSERTREAVLRDSRERLAQVIDTVPAMISAADAQGRCIFVNACQAALAGVDPGAVVGGGLPMFGEEHGERSRARDRRVFETGEPLPSFEEEIVDRHGVRRVFLTSKTPLRDGDRVVSVLTTSLDITDRKRAEGHLLHMAQHDGLTGLPNRALLHERLRHELARTDRAGRLMALHFLDLDRFKGVNDVLGHHVGDRLLRVVAGRLQGAVRETDTVARLGGDEFAVLQTDAARPEDAADLARRIIRVLARPIPFQGREIHTSASVGVTLHPTDGGDLDELLKNADLAMYRAKAEGRNAYRFFTPDMNSEARRAVILEADLRLGLARGQFVLHYQPQTDLKTGRIVGAEALLRWKRPGWGLLRPSEFLPFAEESGLIIPINEWALREACTRAVAWRQKGLPPLRVAVNLSPAQFRDQDVRRLVTRVLETTGLEPRRLELELTESIVVQNAETAAACLRHLEALGVRFAIDDFGTGYSSMSYVKRFPVHRLKIDRSFIGGLATDPHDAAIVRAIINLGHSLDLGVIAEGVETAEQAERLLAEGCDEVQGHHFSRPLPPESFAALLREGDTLPRRS